jgi:ADP-dependent NAD(P)H-hydrate dehydratase / NAD(P)H-hydrate epimerase
LPFRLPCINFVKKMRQDGLLLKECRRLEEAAKKIGFSERTLVENASCNLSRILINLNLGRDIAVIAGKGNNGADVLSCARKLYNQGLNVKVVVLRYGSYSPELLWQKSIIQAQGVPLKIVGKEDLGHLASFFKKADYLLDGIFGIGIKGEIDDLAGEVIEHINKSGKKVVSCDIPSGLSPDEGIALGQAVKADYTITFIGTKQGFYLNQGPGYCGKIIVTDIGLSKTALERIK